MDKNHYKYPTAMRLLHWIMAFLILGLIIVGWYMHQLPDDAPNKYDLYPWHKSFGVLVLILWLVRVLIKAIARGPLKSELSDEQMRLASRIHFLMYILMLLVPISGYVMSVSGGHGVKLFGLVLPNLIPENETVAHWAHVSHEYLPYILLVFIGLHLAAIIRHRIVDDVNVLKRML